MAAAVPDRAGRVRSAEPQATRDGGRLGAKGSDCAVTARARGCAKQPAPSHGSPSGLRGMGHVPNAQSWRVAGIASRADEAAAVAARASGQRHPGPRRFELGRRRCVYRRREPSRGADERPVAIARAVSPKLPGLREGRPTRGGCSRARRQQRQRKRTQLPYRLVPAPKGGLGAAGNGVHPDVPREPSPVLLLGPAPARPFASQGRSISQRDGA